MGIIQQAVLSDNHIRNTRELIESQIETLRTVYEHNAITEAEYNRSLAVMNSRLANLSPRQGGQKLSDVIGSFRNMYA